VAEPSAGEGQAEGTEDHLGHFPYARFDPESCLLKRLPPYPTFRQRVRLAGPRYWAWLATTLWVPFSLLVIFKGWDDVFSGGDASLYISGAAMVAIVENLIQQKDDDFEVFIERHKLRRLGRSEGKKPRRYSESYALIGLALVIWNFSFALTNGRVSDAKADWVQVVAFAIATLYLPSVRFFGTSTDAEFALKANGKDEYHWPAPLLKKAVGIHEDADARLENLVRRFRKLVPDDYLVTSTSILDWPISPINFQKLYVYGGRTARMFDRVGDFYCRDFTYEIMAEMYERLGQPKIAAKERKSCKIDNPAAYEAAGRPDKLIEFFRLALDDREARLGPDHPETLSVQADLAAAYARAGLEAEAIPPLERSLADLERVQGKDGAGTFSVRRNLAISYVHVDEPVRAIPLLERNLAGLELLLGSADPYTLRAQDDLALAYRGAGQYDKAIPLLERTLSDWNRQSGPDNSDALQVRIRLALALEMAGRVTEAVPLYERSLAGYERELGPDHPSTRFARSHLAGAYWMTGDYARSIATYEEVLAAAERVFGPDDIDTLDALGTLADACRLAGQNDRAIPLLEQAVAAAGQVLGPDHPDTVALIEALLACLRPARPSRPWQRPAGPSRPRWLRRAHRAAPESWLPIARPLTRRRGKRARPAGRRAGARAGRPDLGPAARDRCGLGGPR
jgi:tetratricopeptide (TPR) repeat protein